METFITRCMLETVSVHVFILLQVKLLHFFLCDKRRNLKRKGNEEGGCDILQLQLKGVKRKIKENTNSKELFNIPTPLQNQT